MRPLVHSLWVLVLAGCGYDLGPHGAVQDSWLDGIGPIAVPVFENDSWRTGLEFPLTDHVLRELIDRTAARLTPRSEASAVVEGRILTVRDRPRDEDQRDRILSSQVEITAEVRVIFPSTGRIMGPFHVLEVAEYVVLRGEDRESATQEALHDLAREIVFRLTSLEVEGTETSPAGT